MYPAKSMPRDVPISQVAGAVVMSWHVVDHVQLLLALRGQADEIRLVCRCGRCHWIVREHHGAEPPKLLATCHACGTKVELDLEVPRVTNA